MGNEHSCMFSQKYHYNGIIHLRPDFISRFTANCLTACELTPPLCLLVCTFNPCRDLLVT